MNGDGIGGRAHDTILKVHWCGVHKEYVVLADCGGMWWSGPSIEVDTINNTGVLCI